MTPINRPLTNDERQLMHELAVQVVCSQTGCSPDAAVEALESFAKDGTLILRGDTENAYLEAGGNVLVHADRDWLALPRVVSRQRPAARRPTYRAGRRPGGGVAIVTRPSPDTATVPARMHAHYLD